ncbi:MAG TPA: hypothetical protein VGR03_07350 [Candidatus Acidoferrum sp.]|nr:hypothetical protein [Candidatus Acidoferrum sp.]
MLKRLALALALFLVLPLPAHADNCGSLSDCYLTILAAVLVALVLAVLIFFFWELIVGAAAEGALASGEIGGEIIGWGTGQAAEAVAQTEAVTQGLTTEAIEGMIEEGLTREWVESQLEMYEKAAENAIKAARNTQLMPRLELMQKLLELWPK